MWLAVAAAVVTATAALVDYVSGAKQAREALESMNETAQQWKDTAAETFYGTSEGLSFFGMSEGDFSRQVQSAQDWLDGLLKVWTDGEKETDEIVSSWTDSFKALTASTREELSNLKATQMKAVIPACRSNSPRTSKRWILWIRKSNLCSRSGRTAISRNLTRSGCRNSSTTREAIEIKYNLSAARHGRL